MPLGPFEIIGLGRSDGGAANGCEFGKVWARLLGAAVCGSTDDDDSESFSASFVAAASKLRPFEPEVPGRATDGLSGPVKRPALVGRGGEDDGMTGLW